MCLPYRNMMRLGREHADSNERRGTEQHLPFITHIKRRFSPVVIKSWCLRTEQGSSISVHFFHLALYEYAASKQDEIGKGKGGFEKAVRRAVLAGDSIVVDKVHHNVKVFGCGMLYVLMAQRKLCISCLICLLGEIPRFDSFIYCRMIPVNSISQSNARLICRTTCHAHAASQRHTQCAGSERQAGVCGMAAPWGRAWRDGKGGVWVVVDRAGGLGGMGMVMCGDVRVLYTEYVCRPVNAL